MLQNIKQNHYISHFLCLDFKHMEIPLITNTSYIIQKIIINKNLHTSLTITIKVLKNGRGQGRGRV
jgi:hypothetical protein